VKKIEPVVPHYSYSGWCQARLGFHFFVALASDAKDLTERRGLVEMSSAGRTDTPATEDPMGTPETGSISTSTATWHIRNMSFTLANHKARQINEK
jgi:hypothetical protein